MTVMVFIAESTFGDERVTDTFFDKTGFSDLAREQGIELINLNRSRVVEVKVEHPLVLETLHIAEEAYEADRIINLPNMKVHYATGITLSLKNMKGIVAGNEKKRFHEVGLDKAIVDLNNTIKPCLNIVDGIVCMEGMGPRGGDMVNLGLILAGGVAAEVDYAGSLIMGYALSEVRHLELYLANNQVDLDQVEVAGEPIEKVRYPFKKVNLSKILPQTFRVHNKKACSSCENAFLLSCQLLERTPFRRIEIYMGELIEEPDSAEGIKIAFGNCCPGKINFDKTIKGCPPYPFALKDYLKSIGIT